MSIANHPKIEMLSPAGLKARKRNPRKHSEKQLAKLAAGIARFGFIVPVVVDDNLEIVAGHARVQAALNLKLELVPVIRVRFMSEADKRAFALAENRLAELGDWDEEILAEELIWLNDEELLDFTGFDLGDINLALDDLPSEQEDFAPPALGTVAVSRLGDLWIIGPHKLFNGDATKINSYELLLGSSVATLIFADAPYNVRIPGNVSSLGKAKARDFLQGSGEMSPAEFTAFLRSVFRLLVLFSSRGSIHFQCMDWRHQREILDAADGVYAELKNLIVWKKSNAGMGSFYRSAHELIFAFKAGSGKHINNFGLGETGRYRTNVWEYEGANTFRKGRDRDLADHPTVKPLAMVMDAILDCSNRGDLVLDPFSGSGVTLTAAHKTQRIGAAIELDPLYVDVSLRRLCAASGLTAMHEDGRTFAQVAIDRAKEEASDD